MRTHRNGKPLTVLADGHPRRMADGKNAFRKMSREQREEFVIWMLDNGLEQVVAIQRIAREQLDTHLERQEENERNKRKAATDAELALSLLVEHDTVVGGSTVRALAALRDALHDETTEAIS